MNWLKRRREELEISQSELTRLLQLEGIDISASAISHWENQRYNPPLENPDFRHALANVLRLEIPELLRRAGYQVLEGSHTEAGERAAHIIDRMKPEDQSKALRILEAMNN